MVCGRCIMTVTEILSRHQIPFEKISLGEVRLEKSILPEVVLLIKKDLQEIGFELITDKNGRIVNRIKSVIIEEIYGSNDFGNKNLSVYLAEELHSDYSHLSTLFSKVEGKSIQSFQQSIKMERAKELLEYNEMPISEIAHLLGFGSPAYLATTFKKATGLSPSHYRTLHIKTRNSLDSV